MSELAKVRARLRELEEAAGCVHPVRLFGHRLDPATGEYWQGALKVACKDRRSAICPACAARYRDDAWHLVFAGLKGGKGVPDSVAGHPMVFATLTAPSFGAVHALRKGPCRPRRKDPRCPHGTPLSCAERHGADDPVIGEPLCPECFDYVGAVLWNAHVGRLWKRTAQLLHHELARGSGRPVRKVREEVRVSYVKVAEFQRRGLVHLHALVRADGPTGPCSSPPPWLTDGLLEAAVTSAARRAQVERVDGRGTVSWGREVDAVALGSAGDGVELAAAARYLAKYAVKGSESTGALARRLTSLAELRRLGLPQHAARLAETAWRLGTRRDLGALRLRAHAHTFGYRGHFATKSQRYSTTFGALREARAAYRRPAEEVESDFRYAGRGYATPGTARLAEVLAGEQRHLRRAVPGGAPSSAPSGSSRPDQGERA